MINRVLIRIKVVQLLYSYLLTENHFAIESQPSAPTKEKRFAYNLYLDILMLMVRISNRIEKRGGYKPLADARFIKKILADDKMKSVELRYNHENFPLAGVVAQLSEKIEESALYKNYVKDLGSGKEDDQIWEHIMNMIVLPDVILGKLISTRENYTMGGFERMKGILADTFKKFYGTRDNISDAQKELSKSMDKARELYFRLLLLPVEITTLRSQQLDDNRHKYLPTQDDLNPNTRFVDNALVKSISDDEEMIRYCEENKLSWLGEHRELISTLLNTIMDSDLYKDYMDFPATDYHTDCEFWRDVFKQIIFDNEDFLEVLENESVFWNDDLDIIGTFLLKTLRRYENNEIGSPILEMYKDSEDASFGKTLFGDVVRNKDLYRRYINDCLNTSSWDSERLAFMDVIIAMTALAEILNFPKIPLVVSINEYIEIAKSYSTAKSGAFVNGLLSGIIGRLREEGVCHKG